MTTARKNTDSTIFRFAEKSYDETLMLLNMAHSYFRAKGRIDKSILSTRNSLAYTKIMSDITTKLAMVMSWLFALRAVHEGEITMAEAKKEGLRLPEIDINLDKNDEIYALLSKPVRHMVERSGELYERIKRMEATLYITEEEMI